MFCLKCRKNRESKNLRVLKTKHGKVMLLSKCAVCKSTKSRSIYEEEAGGLLSNLSIRTPLRKITLLGSILF